VKRILLAVVLLLSAACTPLAPTVPTAAVRPVSVGGSNTCSAVVIAPKFALTARHCLSRDLAVDGLPADYVTAAAPQNEDVALIHVPGLRCPCASIGARPVPGDTIVAVGFPVKAEGKQVVSPEAKVKHVGTVDALAPWLGQIPMLAGAVFIFSDRPIIDHGDSGGGVFVLQEREWKLVGINSIGVPVAPSSPFMPPVAESASGFVPVDIADKFLVRL
jgi:hypothetical protein